MFQVGEDLSLHHEAAQDRVGVHAAIDELDGHLFAILIIGADREKDVPIPPWPISRMISVWTDAIAGVGLRGIVFSKPSISINPASKGGRV